MPGFIRQLKRDEYVLFQSVEKDTIKLKSIMDRLYFLNECEIFGIYPKCVRLKRTFSQEVPLSTEQFAKKALIENIVTAKRRKKELQTYIDENSTLLYGMVSDNLQSEISSHLENIVKKVNKKLMKKLVNLVKSKHKCENFLNLSNIEFTELEIAILNMGPKHVFRDNFHPSDIVSYFERAAYKIPSEDGVENELAKSQLNSLKLENIKENRYNQSSNVLKNLVKKLKTLPVVITKADKESKLVAMNEEDYKNGLNKLLSDETKFRKYKEPPRGRGRPSSMNVFEKKTEEVINFVKSVSNLGNHVTCKHPTRQPYLYGLAKTHKNKQPVPLRPVLSATNCYNFSLAKFISRAISPYCYSKYCLNNVDEFKERLNDFKNDISDEMFLVSYDVESLFTNVPLNDAIEKLLDKIFNSTEFFVFEDVTFSKDQLRNALNLCSKDQLFLFNEEVYEQIDGNSMGSPLGPPLSNFYVSYIEDNLINFNSDIAPKFYSRYVDDVFVIFFNPDHYIEFLNHLNSVSKPLKFTFEQMENNKINYIGLTVSNDLSISIINKAPVYNFSSTSSHVPDQYLFAAINCLTHRAITFTDNVDNLNLELIKIKESAKRVDLPHKKVENIINKRLDKLQVDDNNVNVSDNMHNTSQSDSKPDPMFVLLPFINKKLSSKAKTFFHNLKVKVSFTTNNNLYTKLRPRESSIKGKFSEANVIYKFKCSSCEKDYIGYTERLSNVTISEHSQIN